MLFQFLIHVHSITLFETLFPCNGKAFNNAWWIRQFEYLWLYVNLWQATEDGLLLAVKQLKLEVSDKKRVMLRGFYVLSKK